MRVKLANVDLDRYRFDAAAAGLEAALALDASQTAARHRLAHCYNALGRPREALETLAGQGEPLFERALAFAALGEDDAAEAELRALLAADPYHAPALRPLGKLLRRAGRVDELLELCEALAAQGVGHAQLLYIWGAALALAGEDERARALLLDPGRIAELELPLPGGFADHAEFNAALAEEILGNPYRLSDFPIADEANRGSSRVQALFAGKRPELVRGLLESLQRLAETWSPPRYGGFDPWPDARPAAARLKAWGLIQRGGEYEEWHLHRGGWLSGVYYVRVPKSVSAAGEGPGCIEFGPPASLIRARPGYLPILRKLPREGHLLLAPSHYAHRTIPSGAEEYRISFAFDVVPHRQAGASEGAAN